MDYQRRDQTFWATDRPTYGLVLFESVVNSKPMLPIHNNHRRVTIIAENRNGLMGALEIKMGETSIRQFDLLI